MKKNNTYKRYINLYRCNNYMGELRILKEFLDLDTNIVLPLSISHAIDFNHANQALDIYDLEPIYWSYNNIIHNRAKKIKESILLPHPFLMLNEKINLKLGKGVLVICTAPSLFNDTTLLNRLKDKKIDLSKCTILLKFRKEIHQSEKYWKDCGLKTITAGEKDDYFYDRLYNILNDFNEIVSCTLSSALVFAAALGKKCTIIENYRFKCYGIERELDDMQLCSEFAREFLNNILKGNGIRVTEMALDILGSNIISNKKIFKNNLFTCLNNIKKPIYTQQKFNIFQLKIYIYISLIACKMGVLKNGFIKTLMQKLKKPYGVLLYLNDIDIFLNGINENNFKASKVEFIKNKTEPGYGAN